MTTGFNVTIDDRSVLDALTGLQRAGDDLRPALRSIGNTLKTHIQLGFRQSQDPYGRPWKPVLRGGQPLRDSGRLRDSIDYHTTDTAVDIGTNVKYAPVHQYGATIHAKNAPYLLFNVGGRWARKKQVTIPARPFMPTDGLPDAWREDVLSVLRKHFDAGADHA